MGGKDTEACGRCSMTTVVDATGTDADPFDGDRIELSDDQLRRVSPGAYLKGVKDRVDAVATRLVHGR